MKLENTELGVLMCDFNLRQQKQADLCELEASQGLTVRPLHLNPQKDSWICKSFLHSNLIHVLLKWAAARFTSKAMSKKLPISTSLDNKAFRSEYLGWGRAK